MDMTLDKKRTEAYAAHLYFELFNKIEKTVKEIFFQDFIIEMSASLRERLIYYAGWIFADVHIIEYDTYSLVRETQKYVGEKVLKRMTLKQIIRFCKKESDYCRFDFSIQSINNKMENISFYTCCDRWIEMRNKLAHLYEEFDFSKNTIEVLSTYHIKNYCAEFLDDSELQNMSQNSIYILSNYIYMQMANEIIQKIGDNYEEKYR